MLKRMQSFKPIPTSFEVFKRTLRQHANLGLRFRLPTGGLTPLHVHFTEVARHEKRFVDCGGVLRTEVTARIQVWCADDTEHRVGTNKAFQILERGADLIDTKDLPLEVEYNFPLLTIFSVLGSVVEGQELIFLLGAKMTYCLAPDICLPSTSNCKPGSGCC